MSQFKESKLEILVEWLGHSKERWNSGESKICVNSLDESANSAECQEFCVAQHPQVVTSLQQVTTAWNTSIYCLHSLLENMETNSYRLQTYNYCLLWAVKGQTFTGTVRLLLTAVLLEKETWRWWPTRKQRKKTAHYMQAENIFLSAMKQRFFTKLISCVAHRGVSSCREGKHLVLVWLPPQALK